MRIASVLSLTSALLLAPTAVSAMGRLGFTATPHKADGSCKVQQDYEEDFKAIKVQSGSTLVRTFSSSDCDVAKYILPAAKAQDAQVILAVWPDVPDSFEKDKDALKQYATEEFAKQLFGVTVGSETLYRKNFTGHQLLEKINDVKSILPKDVLCGTADTWNRLSDGTADPIIQGGVDLLLVNAFSYWQGTPIDKASETYFSDMAAAIEHIQKIAGGPEKSPLILGGETGWPSTGGSSYGFAKAGNENAATYFSQAVCGMLKWGVGLFYFSAFDEPGKANSVGENGEAANEQHWGAMTADRKAKFDLSCK